MPDDARPAAPGDMTVLPWAGWEEVLTGVLLLAAVALALLLLVLARPGQVDRAEWQAWLDARPSRRSGPPEPPDAGGAGGAGGPSPGHRGVTGSA